MPQSLKSYLEKRIPKSHTEDPYYVMNLTVWSPPGVLTKDPRSFWFIYSGGYRPQDYVHPRAPRFVGTAESPSHHPYLGYYYEDLKHKEGGELSLLTLGSGFREGEGVDSFFMRTTDQTTLDWHYRRRNLPVRALLVQVPKSHDPFSASETPGCR